MPRHDYRNMKSSPAPKPVVNKILATTILIILLMMALFRFFPKKNIENTAPVSAERALARGRLDFLQADGTLISSITVEFAEDDYARGYGLMFRKFLPFDHGMLFIFPEERYQSFWMKNTAVSLDMIFLNNNKEIINIARDTQPFAEKNYSSAAPARYVLEVVAGYSDQWAIGPGVKVNWSRDQ